MSYPMADIKEDWLVTSNHLEKHLLFREEDDFKAGMNRVTILAARGEVRVLSFILMSNHVHFVLRGAHVKAQAFFNDFKRGYGRYMQEKYGIHGLLRRNGVHIQRVEKDDESLERAIAYVQMNSVAANICLSPEGYPWGTGATFFNQVNPGGTELRRFSQRAQCRMLHTREYLPPDWIVCAGGYILPKSYVDIKAVEGIFHTPRRMLYFLQQSSKARKVLSDRNGARPSFRDQVIAATLPDLCESLFQTKKTEELNQQQMTELLRQIRFRFSSNVHQCARICGLSYESAARLLDSL